jgi:hypothetical protein
MASRKELTGALGALLRRIETVDALDDLRRGNVLGSAAKVFASASRGNIARLPWTPLRRVPHGAVSQRQIGDAMRMHGVTEAEARGAIERIIAEESLWTNDIYQVSVRDLGEGRRHLSIKRIDQEPVHDWRDLQRIKNELLGVECEAVELYPAEGRRVDTANQYHLWGFADPAFRFGFGFDQRVIASDTGSHLQRRIDDGEAA